MIDDEFDKFNQGFEFSKLKYFQDATETILQEEAAIEFIEKVCKKDSQGNPLEVKLIED